MSVQRDSAPRSALRPLARGIALAMSILAGMAAAPVRANPQGGVVVGGSASILQPSPALTSIRQYTPNAIINWQSFSIGMGEAVRFNQPSPASAVLNRVVGNDPSSIFGSLSANGRVYLVNQNGVFVGPNAQIDTAALVLSTADIGNDDFMAGRMNFDRPGRPGARIVNEGRITAREGGLVALVAPGVENRGVISARLGQVVLGGAPAFSLDLLGDGMVNVLLSARGMQNITDAGGKPLSTYVDTTGRITAEGGRIWISAAQAKGIVDSMVHVGGELRATRVAQQGGVITLLGGDSLAVAGSVLAGSADGRGGSIDASADKVLLAAHAVLDASGAAGGGSVQVGGAYQGRTPVAGAQATARDLAVDAGARIAADATGSAGSGGQVVLWSEEGTRFQGSVSARAAAGGGDGGSIEVSGRKWLAFDGKADASAPAGKAGTLLLDPGSLTVAEGGSSMAGSSFSASGADATVAAGAINDVLRGGTSVTLQADDDILVNARIDGRPYAGSSQGLPGAGLGLTAGRAVKINAPIILNGGSFTSTSGSFEQAAGTSSVIATLGAQPIRISTSGDISTQYLLTSGDVTLSSSAGSISTGQALGGDQQPIASLTVSAAQGSAAVLQGLRTTGNATLTARDLTLGQAIVGGTLKVGAGSNLSMQGSALVGALVAGTDAAPIGSFSMAGPAGGALPWLGAGKGGVSVVAASIGTLGEIRSDADIGLSAAVGDVTLNRMESTAAGNIAVSSGGSIDLPSGRDLVSRGGAVSLTANGGGISADGSISANGVIGSGTPDAGQLALPGRIQLSARDDISVRQLVAGGGVSIDSATGGVTLVESLGGASDKQPLIGSLQIHAGGDVVTNGLNLVGTAAAGGRGLSIDAGGHIVVNDRIGVDRGDLWFGPETPVTDAARSAQLYQGVYGRSGQNITFNVPVVADGSKIVAGWQPLKDEFLQTGQGGEKFVDMVLIPYGFNNSAAENLVNAGGGLFVQVDAGTKAVTAICATSPGECAGTPGTWYWMIPKIVISNQERPQPTDGGAIRLLGGVSTPGIDAQTPTTAIKLIVPGTSVEAEQVIVDAIQNDINSYGSSSMDLSPIGRIEIREPGPFSQGYVSNLSNACYAEGEGVCQADIENVWLDAGQGGGSLTVIAYAGKLGTVSGTINKEFNYFPDPQDPEVLIPDAGHLVPTISDSSYGFSYSSNSSPENFINPAVSGGTSLSLGQQLAAVIPGQYADPNPANPTNPTNPVNPADPTGANPGTAQQTAGLDAQRAPDVLVAGRQDDSRACPQAERDVVGRSSGDEGDVGMTAALRGAPRPVFDTNYALGDVDAQLTSADVASIRGRRQGRPCL